MLFINILGNFFQSLGLDDILLRLLMTSQIIDFFEPKQYSTVVHFLPHQSAFKLDLVPFRHL